jgi:hypothetical protein
VKNLSRVLVLAGGLMFANSLSAEPDGKHKKTPRVRPTKAAPDLADQGSKGKSAGSRLKGYHPHPRKDYKKSGSGQAQSPQTPTPGAN